MSQPMDNTTSTDNEVTPNVTLQDIYRARQKIAPVVRRTPLMASPALSERTGARIWLKAENLQETGAFKLRGATNKLLSLSPEEQARGIITVSTGNHGRAVAYVARRLDVPAVICLSEAVPPNKIKALRQLGAELVVHGRSYDEALARALTLQKQRGLTWVDPFDDPQIIAGQGTIGLELLEDLPQIELAVVPLSGGGLISGIGVALKAANPAIRLVGVSMERAPVMYHSLRAGRPVEMEELETLADALAGGIGTENLYTFRLVQQYVDETVLVSEQEIAGGMLYALDQHHLVLEGAGAVGLAALLYAKVGAVGHTTAVVLSGSNVRRELLTEIMQDVAQRRM